MKSKLLLISAGLLFIMSVFLGGCFLFGQGMIALHLTDDPGPYEAVNVTFTEISVHRAGNIEAPENPEDSEGAGEGDSNWIVISDEEQTYNLLDLQSPNWSLFAWDLLDVGKYTQIRLKISEANVVLANEETHELIVPSGATSGLKFTHPFIIRGGLVTTIEIDFDADKSVVEEGDGTYHLKPTIKIKDKVISEEPDEQEPQPVQ